MKKILLSSALAGGLAAVIIGMAAPASAAPSWTAPPQPGDSVMLNGPKAPADPHNYEKDDRHPYGSFGIAKHPYNDSLIPRPSGNSSVIPGQLPSRVSIGPVIGLR